MSSLYDDLDDDLERFDAADLAQPAETRRYALGLLVENDDYTAPRFLLLPSGTRIAAAGFPFGLLLGRIYFLAMEDGNYSVSYGQDYLPDDLIESLSPAWSPEKIRALVDKDLRGNGKERRS